MQIMARKLGIEIEIDRLTNSIVNVISGDILETEFHKVTGKEITKKDWLFNWHRELSVSKNEVYKMTIKDNPTIIQGLISYEVIAGFVAVNLVENAKFNRGKNKIYEGVGGNLFAFACKQSKKLGYDGCIAFYAKTSLVDYYQIALGAKLIFGQRMVIEEKQAHKLINQYFKD